MNYRKMIVWQKSMQLLEIVYLITEKLPREETYGLISQMRRAVVSISSNIAEGAGRITDNDLRHFMSIARGSANELESQLIACEMLHFLEAKDLRLAYILLTEIQKILSVLIVTGKAG